MKDALYASLDHNDQIVNVGGKVRRQRVILQYVTTSPPTHSAMCQAHNI